MKKVTIKDVAKVANVSYTTVSRALSGSPDIGEATRARIVKISQEMGYTANSVARSLVARESKTMGLIVSTINSPFTAEIAYYVEQQAWANGYSLMLCNSGGNPDKEEAAYRLLVSRQVDGIIIKPSHLRTYDRIAPYLNTVPTVFINEIILNSTQSYVCIDNYAGTCAGTEYLHSLGHRDIVFFGRRGGKTTREARAQGYADTCKKHDIPPRYVDNTLGQNTTAHGYAMALDFFSKNPRDYTAIFANTDVIALGVLRAADELNIRIPEDISLLGFDNITYAALPRIDLTTIGQPKQEIAAVAVNMLLEKIQYPSLGYSQRMMRPSLVVRSSCRDISLDHTPPQHT